MGIESTAIYDEGVLTNAVVQVARQRAHAGGLAGAQRVDGITEAMWPQVQTRLVEHEGALLEHDCGSVRVMPGIGQLVVRPGSETLDEAGQPSVWVQSQTSFAEHVVSEAETQTTGEVGITGRQKAALSLLALSTFGLGGWAGYEKFVAGNTEHANNLGMKGLVGLAMLTALLSYIGDKQSRQHPNPGK